MKLIQEQYEHNGLYITLDYSPKGMYVTVQTRNGKNIIHDQPVENYLEILKIIQKHHEN